MSRIEGRRQSGLRAGVVAGTLLAVATAIGGFFSVQCGSSSPRDINYGTDAGANFEVPPGSSTTATGGTSGTGGDSGATSTGGAIGTGGVDGGAGAGGGGAAGSSVGGGAG